MSEAPDVAPKQISALRPQAKRRTLVVASADDDCLSRNLIHAVELEFAWIDVAIASSVEAALGRFEQPVALVLVDASLLGDLSRQSAELARRHPGARFALFQPEDRAPPALRDILACPQVRSVLPMNLKLDVWLAAMRIILIGGDYLPFTLLRSAADPIEAADADRQVGRRASALADADFRDLTQREVQILEFVARGLQNKVIASTLGLSEHTVKIHLHNIIRKLCVHNRTEAARFYLDSMAASGPGGRNTAAGPR